MEKSSDNLQEGQEPILKKVKTNTGHEVNVIQEKNMTGSRRADDGQQL